ncbi:hypothetical protein EUGRSUZ_G01753 [Eucalyptus grandis]|uniref:Uncharacterized protein n=1 Tax=Eucalyptus grandis TaxID=71139 RepID=A0ACC3K3K0_EUCGR|nr:hypothetical protein EUGRSUZ_G01753 [Eucalyptus grandis]
MNIKCRKVEIALDYVRTRGEEGGDGPEQDCDTVKLSRVIVFLSDWIQSLLISSAKKVKLDGEQHDVVKACLDARCWEIFKFCLEKSSRLQIPLNFSQKLLQPIQFIARHVLLRLNDSPMHAEESFLTDEGFELFNLMVDCVSLLYGSHNVTSNESLEQWISTVHTVIELVNRIFTESLDSRKAGVLVLQFSCFVLGPFAKFLRIHPTRKSGFSDFVHKLLEPLLQLFGHLRGNRNNPGLTGNLLRSVDEVLSNGVFHPIHIEGFLTLHSSDKYVTAGEGKSKDSKIIVMSYHRHLFEELEKIMTSKKMLALKGVSKLFHLLVKQVRKLRGASMPIEGSSASTVSEGSKQLEHGLFGPRSKMLSMASDINSERDYSLVNLSSEARKSQFKVSVHKAISSIPEGQASGCIQQLAEDISESLIWIKRCCSKNVGEESGGRNSQRCAIISFNLYCELLGKGLSEIYSCLLDSITVTASNSVAVGSSINNLMAVIRPSLSSLVEPQSVSLRRNFDKKLIKKIMSKKFGLSSHWAFVFFFRLYLSCRSLYRQAISLMPPNSSIKMSAFMGDSFTSCSGKDWTERDDLPDDVYFSWVVKPSASVLTVIQSVSDIYLQNRVADCCCLVYILYAMALQRLVDLNRQIKSAGYVLQSKKEMLCNISLDVADHSTLCGICQKWEENVVNMRQEAQGLADFVMRYLTFLVNDPLFSTYSEANTNPCAQSPLVSNQWDFGLGSLNEKTLLTAIWWIICQSIDIWCIHASIKNMKMFLYFLIQSSLPAITENPFKYENPSEMLYKSVHQISYEVLHDSTFHEHKKVDLGSSPNWSHCLMELQKSVSVDSGSKSRSYYSKQTAPSFNKESIDNCAEIRTSQSMSFAACMDLLNLFSRMPKDYLSSRSFKRYATHIINIERLAASSLLDFQDVSFSSKHNKHLKLFLYCRKALKHLVEASFSDNIEITEHLLSALISEGIFSLVWLFKSVVVVSGLQDECGEYNSCKENLSLMDHTSYIFLMFSEYYFCQTLSSIIMSTWYCKEKEGSDIGPGQTNLVEPGSCWDPSKHSEAWKSICLVAQSMKEETQSLFCSLEESFHDKRANVGQNSLDMTKLSAIMSCLSGFFWGLASAVDQIDAKDQVHKVISSHWKHEPLCKLGLFIDVFTDVVSIFLRIMLGQNDQQLGYLGHEQSSKMLNYSQDILGSDGLSHGDSSPVPKISSHSEQKDVVTAFLESSGFTNQSVVTDVGPQLSHVEGDDCVASISNEVNFFDSQYLNKPFLQQLLKGDNPEAAFLLRHLFIGYSAILKLNLKNQTLLLSTTLLRTFMAMAQFLILELVNGFELPQPSSFVCLDGILKYLGELGSHFPYTNPTLSRNAYARLIELQLVALGKCIVLQGKRYTLMNHETGSSTKTIPGHARLNGSKDYRLECCLDDIKARLRTSFTIYIKKAAELHLLSAVQAIERALVGVQECCTAKCGITFGRVGGTVSPVVAAGIDLLDMLLENVSGRKRLSVVRRHIQSFMAGLFNIILHVQSPRIFYESSPGKGFGDPDPGSVTLMCIEVLIRVSGRHALFQLDPWHVAQMLRIPAALFQVFCQFQLKDTISSGSLFSLENLEIDRPFSVKLYATCCRLLCTVLKHHKSECERDIALLQDSTSVLLNCLETVNMDLVVRQAYLSRDVREGVKCACSLRRIYEELRQQKDVYGRHCFKFLSSYIYTCSECGPLKGGFRREIDEALRPGVYALIDACSADDLQYLHTVFGEGPCRNTLASLQHDYKVYFQYGGKV